MNRFPPFLLVLFFLASCSGSPSRPEMPDLLNRASPETDVLTGGQPDAADLVKLGKSGFRQVIDLRQDAETPDFDEAKAARDAGLSYASLPIAGAAGLTRENVQAFDRLLADAQRPVLVHCASGNRVGAMAALRAAWIEGHSPEDAIAIGKRWGLKALEPTVRALLEAPPPR